ncbi:putative ribonuclease H-like domain-containing protein [Tanacetum coccineum]
MHVVPPPIIGTFMPPSNRPDLDDTQFTYGSKSNISFETNSVSNDFVSYDNSDKSSDSETTDFASCVSSVKSSSSKTNEPLASTPSSVDFKTMSETAVQQPSSTNDDSSFSFKENVKPPRHLCNKSGINSRSFCKRKSFGSKTCFVCGSKFHLIKDCDFYEKQLELNNKPMWTNVANIPSFVPKAASVPADSRNRQTSVPTDSRNRQTYVPAGSRNEAASVPADSRNRQTSVPAGSRNEPASVPTDSRNRQTFVPAGSRNRPTSVPAGRPFSAGWKNNAARPMTRPTSHYFQHFRRPGYYNHLNMDEGRWGTAENPHKNRDLGIVDSGCSRSMTGNKEKLDDFVKIVGGTVTFGGGDGKITGKGTIRTSKLNFENVYYVEDLQNFNLFSVSQICDTKNKVLFTDKECLVLSKEFQLPENSQVVLRIPRRHNLYCFNLSDIHPASDVSSLLAKASLEESTKWHRRMAHVNFKNMNKLAKHGLVNGLPSKLFTNEHNCVACNKGKQHKASYKAITAVSTISAPLQLLHMDLFGPTSIRSIDHKYYSLVVTDDFSRFTWVFFLGTKDETYGILKDFITFIENQLTTKVKAIRCDNGTEAEYVAAASCCGQVYVASDMVISSFILCENLLRLQKQEYEANAIAEKHLSQADLATSRNRVPAGRVDFAAGVTDGPTDPSTPVFQPVHTAAQSLPPSHSLGSSEHSSRYPSLSDLANSMSLFSDMEDIHHHSKTGIFSSSSYDDDFGGTVTNLAPSVVVSSVPTKRVNTIHPQSQILGDLTSPVQTRGTLMKSKFGASAFVSYVYDQQRNNHTDYLHCLFACFLSQLEPSSVAQALNDPAWIEAMQEEMQQFVNQDV